MNPIDIDWGSEAGEVRPLAPAPSEEPEKATEPRIKAKRPILPPDGLRRLVAPRIR
jgi:hypothetical protein